MCADSPDSTLGSITWQQTAVSDSSGDSTAATITAQFIQSDGLGFAPPLALLIGLDGYSAPSGLAVPIVLPQSPPAASACSASLPTTLDAGELNLSGPGFGPLTMTRSTQDGRLTYEVPAPGGAIRPGAYEIDGSGGQVGAFTARGQIPAPVSITTNLQPGSRLTVDANGNYTFAWTGGSDDSVVTVQFILVDAAFEAVAVTSASAGLISISESELCRPAPGGFCFQPLSPGQSVELIITQTPPKAPSLPFSAPGLGMGGELTWTYTFDFKGLTT
jgi:hypothetical protein